MPNRKPIVGANWKCNPDKVAKLPELVTNINACDASKCDVYVCPSSLHVGIVYRDFTNGAKVAPQNCNFAGCGAYTGEMAVDQMKAMGIEWVLIGHSERRGEFGLPTPPETNALLATKLAYIQKQGLKCVLAIGEPLPVRKKGLAAVIATCAEQLAPMVQYLDPAKVVIAYEPVWAIGTGESASAAQAQETHKALRDWLRANVGSKCADNMRIQYGGSANAKNAAELSAQPDIDGFLVGSASLKPEIREIVCALAAAKQYDAAAAAAEEAARERSRALRRKRNKTIVINPTADIAFTAIFFLEIALVFYALEKGAALGLGSIPPRSASLALVAACAFVFAVIFFVKWSSVAIGSLLSRAVFPGDPLRKTRQLHKFRDQMWQLAIHVSMTLLEVYILFFEEGSVEWWSNHAMLWSPHPHVCAESTAHAKWSIHLLYLLQMAIWVDTCFGHRFLEERHKDYLLMYLHHVVTIALVGFSYHYNYTKVGVIVLFVHDVSDIPLDLLKIFNYCQLEGLRGLFLVELDYVFTLATWAYFRFYVFGKLLFYGVVAASREVGFAPQAMVQQVVPDACMPRHQLCMAAYDKTHGGFGRGHVKGALLGDGSFDVWKSFETMGWAGHECIPLFWEATALLALLQLMHYVWFGMLINVIVKKLASEATFHDGARDVYEGESDDENDEDGPTAKAGAADERTSTLASTTAAIAMLAAILALVDK